MEIGVNIESSHFPSLYVGPNFEECINLIGGMTLLDIFSSDRLWSLKLGTGQGFCILYAGWRDFVRARWGVFFTLLLNGGEYPVMAFLSFCVIYYFFTQLSNVVLSTCSNSFTGSFFNNLNLLVFWSSFVIILWTSWGFSRRIAPPFSAWDMYKFPVFICLWHHFAPSRSK